MCNAQTFMVGSLASGSRHGRNGASADGFIYSQPLLNIDCEFYFYFIPALDALRLPSLSAQSSGSFVPDYYYHHYYYYFCRFSSYFFFSIQSRDQRYTHHFVPNKINSSGRQKSVWTSWKRANNHPPIRTMHIICSTWLIWKKNLVRVKKDLNIASNRMRTQNWSKCRQHNNRTHHWCLRYAFDCMHAVDMSASASAV